MRVMRLGMTPRPVLEFAKPSRERTSLALRMTLALRRMTPALKTTRSLAMSRVTRLVIREVQTSHAARMARGLLILLMLPKARAARMTHPTRERTAHGVGIRAAHVRGIR